LIGESVRHDGKRRRGCDGSGRCPAHYG
jgi:hypothetical protein